MTAFLITLLGLIFVLAALYWLPLPGKSSNKLFANVDDRQRSALQAFRLENQLQRIHAKGLEWNYLKTGAGERTIVFLHGMGGGFDIWFQQINHFKTSYRIISMTYPPVSSLAELSEGVMAILDRENIDSATIVGSSLGGYFAQYLVKSHPGKIEKAVFANTFPPNRIHAEKIGKMKFILPLLPAWMVMRNLRQTTQAAIYPASGHSELVRAYMLEQSYGMMQKSQFVARLRCVLDHFEPPNLDELNIPCLIIETDNDPLVEKDLREMLKTTYPSVSVETLSQQGHFPYLNAPDTYNRILEQFIIT